MLEVCVDTIQAAILAEKAGADRIELCSALDLGGATPSGPLVSAVRRVIQVPLIVLIRSRTGDFLYEELECELMIQEAIQAIEYGADGIAIGGLIASRELNIPFLLAIVNALPKCQLVMHRAFDQISDPATALGKLIDLGFTRILTSGGREMAIDGLQNLCRLSEWARGRIEILPGGGVAPANAEIILAKSRSCQLHGSFRTPANGKGTVRLPDPVAISQTKAILTASNEERRCSASSASFSLTGGTDNSKTTPN